jgi:hypothetical protein
MKNKVKPEGGSRTEAEKRVGRDIARVFSQCPDSIETKLDHFPKYVKRQKLTRLLALYEIFKKVLPIKGSIIECGVYRGFGLMAWANFSAVLEPNNLTRRVYGFDTFEGFTSVGEKDKSDQADIKDGDLYANCFEELADLIKIYDANRFLGHVNKMQLINGDATRTIPEFIEKNKHLVVSLLFLDFDLFEPTKIALDSFFPRIPKGGIIAFDELDNPIWPGETMALLETIGINKLRIERLEFDPYIGFAIVD